MPGKNCNSLPYQPPQMGGTLVFEQVGDAIVVSVNENAPPRRLVFWVAGFIGTFVAAWALVSTISGDWSGAIARLAIGGLFVLLAMHMLFTRSHGRFMCRINPQEVIIALNPMAAPDSIPTAAIKSISVKDSDYNGIWEVALELDDDYIAPLGMATLQETRDIINAFQKGLGREIAVDWNQLPLAEKSGSPLAAEQ